MRHRAVKTWNRKEPITIKITIKIMRRPAHLVIVILIVIIIGTWRGNEQDEPDGNPNTPPQDRSRAARILSGNVGGSG